MEGGREGESIWEQRDGHFSFEAVREGGRRQKAAAAVCLEHVITVCRWARYAVVRGALMQCNGEGEGREGQRLREEWAG